MQKYHYFIGMPTHQPQFIICQTQKRAQKNPARHICNKPVAPPPTGKVYRLSPRPEIEKTEKMLIIQIFNADYFFLSKKRLSLPSNIKVS